MHSRAPSTFAACPTLLLASTALAVPFWGAKEPMPAGTDPATLKPGVHLEGRRGAGGADRRRREPDRAARVRVSQRHPHRRDVREQRQAGSPGADGDLHGCIHLPSEFAKLLFQISPMGMTVVVAAEHEAPEDVVHPAAIAPVDPKTGQEDELPRLAANEDQRWQREKSPDGPVSILVSGADRRVLVYRNGVEIGRAKIELRDPRRRSARTRSRCSSP